MSSITYTVEIKWVIKGYSDYGFGSDKNLYNLKTGHRLKQSYNSGSIGYWLSKKFMTLNILRSLIQKPKIDSVPF